MSRVQPRASGLSVSSLRRRRKSARTADAGLGLPASTMGIRASGGILLSKMLQPIQPARRAVGASGLRHSIAESAKAK